MATYLPGSGAISLNDINTVFGRGNNLNSYRGTTYYTSTAGPFTFSSGAIDMNSFHGTGPIANRVAISYTFSSNAADASLNVASISGYAAGTSDITITVNSGIYLWASSTGNAGLTLTGGTSGDTITIVNNGYIMGCGGHGGDIDSGGYPVTPTPSGGTALSLGFTTTVNNTNGSAYIGGGGGGGGSSALGSGGGGAGGGNSGILGAATPAPIPGALGGSIGSVGANGTYYAGGGGGRIFPGSGGAGGSGTGKLTAFPGSGGGAGGGGGATGQASSVVTAGSGGAGSAAGGNYPVPATYGAGGGGGWGASGGSSTSSGGGGGKAVALNGYSVSWVSGDTTRVYGAVS